VTVTSAHSEQNYWFELHKLHFTTCMHSKTKLWKILTQWLRLISSVYKMPIKSTLTFIYSLLIDVSHQCIDKNMEGGGEKHTLIYIVVFCVKPCRLTAGSKCFRWTHCLLTLKIQSVYSSGTLVTTYEAVCYNYSEDHDLNLHCYKTTKCNIIP
jgi:hypothetical protein